MWQEISDRDAWNEFVIESNGQFLQSFEFGQFHASLGKKVVYLAFVEEEIKGVCLLIEQRSKLSHFFYCPGGPLLKSNNLLKPLIIEITRLSKEESIDFVRLDPREVDENLASELTRSGLVRAKKFTQPECTQIISLSKELEEIKSNFSESTRYNVGWVERQGVFVEVSEKIEDFALFENLLLQTASRQSFQLHGEKGYYRKQFEAFVNHGLAKLYLAYEPRNSGNEVLAAAVIINFGKKATYLHAASSRKHPKLRAPYLMQWKVIQNAKRSGFEVYDFWGVAKDDNPADPWSGITAFKKGFGGRRVCYQPPYDLILTKKYYLETLVENSRMLFKKWL